MKFSSIVRVLALAALVTVAAVAPAVAGKGKGAGRGMIERIIKRLELTQDQQSRIKAIRDQFKTQNAALIADMKAVHQQAREARKAGDADRAKAIREAAQAKGTQLKAAREAMIQQILAVLTPEQRAELDAMKAERKAKKGAKKGKRQGRAGGNGATID